MKKRHNAAICFFAVCLMAVSAPAKILAQAAEAGTQMAQELTEDEGTGESLAADPEDGPESGMPEEDWEAEDLTEADPSFEEQKEAEEDIKSQPDIDETAEFQEEISVEELTKKPKKDAQAEQEAVQKEEKAGPEKVTVDPEDPGKYRLTGRGTGDFSAQSIRKNEVSHQDKYEDCIKQWGIDVSYHNGTIDWKKVKADGIEFAFIRVAYRGYKNGKLVVDTQALRNMKNANKEGIPIGVYIFSQAVSAAEARQEADFIVKQIKNYQIDLPVVLDFEYVATGVGRLYHAKLSKSAGTSVCKAFCDRVKKLGYTPMVYSGKNMYEEKTYAADFSQEYPIWMAHYTDSTSYAGEYEYWQYTPEGKVKGIKTKDNPYTDLNCRYYNTLRITKRAVKSLTMSWDAWEDAESYDIYRRNGSGDYEILVSGVESTAYTDKSLKPGEAYSYKIYPHESDTCIGFNTGITRLAAAKLSGKGTAFDKVKLTWPKVPGASSYHIERYNSSKKAYASLKKASGKLSSHTDGSRNAATKYKYRMRPYKVVFNGRTYGEYSKEVSVKTKAKVKATTKAKKLVLRKSASKSSKSLGTIKKKGTKVTVTGSNGSWYRLSVKIKGKTKTGYIKKSSIKLTK